MSVTERNQHLEGLTASNASLTASLANIESSIKVANDPTQRLLLEGKLKRVMERREVIRERIAALKEE